MRRHQAVLLASLLMICITSNAYAFDWNEETPIQAGHTRMENSWRPSESTVQTAQPLSRISGSEWDHSARPLPAPDNPQWPAFESEAIYHLTGHGQPPAESIPPLPEEPKYPTIRATGFFHLDAAWFNQDRLNRDTVGDIQDGVTFQRARIAATGNVTEDVSYIMEFDFAALQARFVDVWLNIGDVPVVGNIRLGRWRQPFGMTELTTIRGLPFLERPTMFALAPFRQTGIGVFNHSDDERMTWAVSAYRYPTNGFGQNIGDNGGWGMASRITFLPYYVNNGERLLHLGADYSFNNPFGDVIRFRSPPEVIIGEVPAVFEFPPDIPQVIPSFVDTGLVSANDTNLFNLEAGGALGRLYLQSEFRWAIVRQFNGPTEVLPAAYAQARYILTGERLPYDRTSGVFGRIQPAEDFSFRGRGIGAWELATRWSYIDFNGRGFPGPGRRLNDLTFGINWYLNQFTKLQLNYIRAFLDDPILGDSTADILAMRGQLDF